MNLVPTRVIAASLGGCSVMHLVSAASTNATSVKASTGTVYGWALSNVNASPRYVKLYNKASAPTVGTDTPAVTIMVPGNANGSGNNFCFTPGIAFGTGIAFAVTANPGDSDNTAISASDVVVDLFYL